MYPILFDVGGFEITSFGVLVALAGITGLLMFRGELRRSGLPEQGLDAAVAGVLGGMVGAKVLWVLEHLGTEHWIDLLFSRGGLSWFGGFAGGIAAALFVIRRLRLSPLAIIAAATPALAIGPAIGRIGCLLVGDDYGVPSTLPWAVAFPNGLPPTTVPVHPTQVYEAVALVPIALMLFRMRRHGAPDRAVLGVYLVSTATIRFLIQWIRVYEPVLGPLGFAHVAALGVMVTSVFFLLRGPHPSDATSCTTSTARSSITFSNGSCSRQARRRRNERHCRKRNARRGFGRPLAHIRSSGERISFGRTASGSQTHPWPGRVKFQRLAEPSR